MNITSLMLIHVSYSTSTFIVFHHFFSESLVLTETLGNVFTIAINRPIKRNCVNPATAKQLVKAFQNFEQNDDLYVAILYGKGKLTTIYLLGFCFKRMILLCRRP